MVNHKRFGLVLFVFWIVLTGCGDSTTPAQGGSQGSAGSTAPAFTAAHLATLNTPANIEVGYLGWSHSGDALASGSGGNTSGSASSVLVTRLWSQSGQPLAALSTSQYDSPYTLLWSPDGTLLAGAADRANKVRLWTTTGTLKTTITLPDLVQGDAFTAWSPDSTTLAFLFVNGKTTAVQLWHTDGTHIGTLAVPARESMGIAWSPDGKLLAIGGSLSDATPTSYLVDMAGTIVATLSGAAWPLSWAPDGTQLATSGPKAVQFWSSTGTVLTTITIPSVKRVYWAPTGAAVALAISGINAQSDTYQIYAKDGTSLGSLDDIFRVDNCAWSPDSRFFAAASTGFPGSLRLWDSTTKTSHTYPGASNYLSMLAWSPDGRYIAAASSDKTGRVWSTDGKLVATLNHASKVYSVAWSPTGILATGAIGEIDLWK